METCECILAVVVSLVTGFAFGQTITKLKDQRRYVKLHRCGGLTSDEDIALDRSAVEEINTILKQVEAHLIAHATPHAASLLRYSAIGEIVIHKQDIHAAFHNY